MNTAVTAHEYGCNGFLAAPEDEWDAIYVVHGGANVGCILGCYSGAGIFLIDQRSILLFGWAVIPRSFLHAALASTWFHFSLRESGDGWMVDIL